MTIGNWGFYPRVTFGKPEQLGLPQADQDLIHVAGVNAEISTLEPSIINDLHKHDRRPLMALLLTSLPNLTTVYAHVHVTQFWE